MSKGASDFKKIPYVGEATEADLLALGYEDIASLKGADSDETNERTKALGRGRCILYVYRMICYYASTPRPDKAKLKWWLWKD
ncbi:helix-hairpin-helix domain-containing protein [uncultured Campylobacter sp.]|uniref:helix-hairpin-helix domain-containing protein n=1 Tax=uncultured Campylobacter sp. TaxID=218934 RepID=UPI00262C0C31|nr:helix-hairpin-helix domain-containing protein [uncultured Campylobacter sp.]